MQIMLKKGSNRLSALASREGKSDAQERRRRGLLTSAPLPAPSNCSWDCHYATKPLIFLGLVAGTTGLEPATSAVTGQRSNQLSYVPNYISLQDLL